MRRDKLGGLDVVVTGGEDRNGGGSGPVVVLLHGFGAPAEDLVPLVRVLAVPPAVRFVFPAAPHELQMMPGVDSRAWWMIDIERMQRAMARGEQRDLSRDTPEGLAEARTKLVAMLDEMETKLSPSSVVLGGFSQGAMLSMDVALRTARSLAGTVLLSGTLLAEGEWLPLMKERKGMPVFQSHGSLDPVLPFSLAERLRDEMKKAELDVTWAEFRGGHEIPGAVLDKLGGFLGRVLA